MTELLEKLNKEQRSAVEAVEGPVMVFAGAGTGKTRTLTARIVHMINNCGIEPKNILAITFTNKAANEMRQRITNSLDEGVNGRVNISTIHSLCARILRKNITKLGFKKDFEIIDEDEANKILSEILKDMYIDKKALHPRAAAKAISDFKNQVRDLTLDEENIYKKYQSYLKENSLVDFDDLLVLTLELLEEHDVVRDYYQYIYRYILVDEFQDTNKTQYSIVKLLAGEKENLFVVGDDDQSIYSFRGACYDNMLDFKKDYPNAQIFKLVQNYRSTNNILKGANALIKNNKLRENKELFSEIPGTVKDIVVHDAYYFEDETRYVVNEIAHLMSHNNYKPSDIAVLYRNNAISRPFELSFIESKIPYNIYGGFSYLKRKEVKDVLSYLRFIVDPTKILHFRRIINTPARGIGDKTIQNVLDYMEEYNLSLFDAIEELNEKYPSTKNGLLKSFKDMIEDLASKIETLDLQDFFDLVLEKTGYLEMLKAEDFGETNRIENVEEFKSILYHVDELYALEGLTQKEKIKVGLDEVVLDQSSENESEKGVVLSTIHSVKGLEFKAVFLVALEEGIFPTIREEADLEEERRVAYVAVTRAKEKLYLSSASRRLIYGRIVRNNKSRFLLEYVIPDEVKEAAEKELQEQVDQGEIKVGSKVIHTYFGYGIVVEADDKFIKVLFEKDSSIRKLMKNHPTITKIKN